MSLFNDDKISDEVIVSFIFSCCLQPSFANRSTFSLPSIPAWPFTHRKDILESVEKIARKIFTRIGLRLLEKDRLLICSMTDLESDTIKYCFGGTEF